MSKTSHAQRERKRTRRGERKTEQAVLVNKGKRADGEQAVLKDRVEHLTEQVNRTHDIEYARDQAIRECGALKEEVARVSEITGKLKSQLQQAQRRIEVSGDLLAEQGKELEQLRSEDRSASKLRRRLHDKTEELKEARAKYNRMMRETQSGKFEDEKVIEQ